MFGSKKRKKAQLAFFSALQYAKGKIEDAVWKDIEDTAKHNEPNLALEILIYNLWEKEVKIDEEGYQIFMVAFQVFNLGKEEYELLDQCRADERSC